MANNFKRYTSRNIGTTAVSVGSYTVPTGRQVTLIGLTIANVTNSPVTVSAVLFDGTNSTHIIRNAPVLVGSTLIIAGGDQKVVLEPGDQIRVTSSASSSVDAIVSLLEITA